MCMSTVWAIGQCNVGHGCTECGCDPTKRRVWEAQSRGSRAQPIPHSLTVVCSSAHWLTVYVVDSYLRHATAWCILVQAPRSSPGASGDKLVSEISLPRSLHDRRCPTKEGREELQLRRLGSPTATCTASWDMHELATMVSGHRESTFGVMGGELVLGELDDARGSHRFGESPQGRRRRVRVRKDAAT